MNNPQHDQKQGKPDQQGQGEQQPAQEQNMIEDLAHQGRPSQTDSHDDKSGSERDRDDLAKETDSPQMDEDREGGQATPAPSAQRGALNTRYATDATRSRTATPPRTVQGSTDEAPDAQGEKSIGGNRDTLTVGRRK